METSHTLITQIEDNETPISLSSTYILAAHSSSSILAATLAQTHLSDIDALILTGYPAASTNNPGGIPSYHYLPAAYNARFPPTLSDGYLLMNSEFNRISAFYYPEHYDPIVAHLDFETSRAQPLGEGFNLGPQTEPAFRGKVLVVTGTKDPKTCGFTPVGECAFKREKVEAVGKAFCGNTGFDWYMPPTGHDVNWHYSASRRFEVVVGSWEA